MSALWNFFTNSTVQEDELPLAEHRREASPDAAGGIWTTLADFFTNAEVRDEELPAPEGRLSPARDTKRSRDDALAEETASPKAASPKAAASAASPTKEASSSALEALIRTSSAEDLAKDRSVTVKSLTDFLVEKGEQVPASAKKGDLIKIASRIVSPPAPAATASQTPSRQSTKGSVEPVKPTSSVSRQSTQLSNKSSQEEAAPTEELPSLRWPLTRLREYAEMKKIKIPNNALKPDIFDLISQNAEFRQQSASLKRQSTSQAPKK